MSLKIVRGDIKNMNTDGLLDASLMSGLGLKFDDEEVVRMCYREVLEQSGRRGYSSLSKKKNRQILCQALMNT